MISPDLVPFRVLHALRGPVSLALCLLSLLAGPARAQCPQSGGEFSCGLIGGPCVLLLPWSSSGPAARLDSSLMGAVPWEAGSPCPDGCYDLRAGLLVAQARNSYPYGCCSDVYTEDVYEIAGPAPGLPLPFVVRLEVVGTTQGSGGVMSSLTEVAPGYVQDWWQARDSTIDFQVQIALQHQVGERFTIACRLLVCGTDLGGLTTASATLRFAGLPEGAHIVSCQGYDLPVPTRATTWGRVKALFR